ncbi:MAG: hypothetical protein EXR99_14720 [Gemmataceae bacterium]|nr:hypothetical protein [Gemmataceae bacterium]
MKNFKLILIAGIAASVLASGCIRHRIGFCIKPWGHIIQKKKLKKDMGGADGDCDSCGISSFSAGEPPFTTAPPVKIVPRIN